MIHFKSNCTVVDIDIIDYQNIVLNTSASVFQRYLSIKLDYSCLKEKVAYILYYAYLNDYLSEDQYQMLLTQEQLQENTNMINRNYDIFLVNENDISYIQKINKVLKRLNQQTQSLIQKYQIKDIEIAPCHLKVNDDEIKEDIRFIDVNQDYCYQYYYLVMNDIEYDLLIEQEYFYKHLLIEQMIKQLLKQYPIAFLRYGCDIDEERFDELLDDLSFSQVISKQANIEIQKVNSILNMIAYEFSKLCKHNPRKSFHLISIENSHLPKVAKDLFITLKYQDLDQILDDCNELLLEKIEYYRHQSIHDIQDQILLDLTIDYLFKHEIPAVRLTYLNRGVYDYMIQHHYQTTDEVYFNAHPLEDIDLYSLVTNQWFRKHPNFKEESLFKKDFMKVNKIIFNTRLLKSAHLNITKKDVKKVYMFYDQHLSFLIITDCKYYLVRVIDGQLRHIHI